jgi:hypothetical protein
MTQKIDKRKTAHKYAGIYAEKYAKIARMAFYDGMIFWDMVKAGIIKPDMIDEDFFIVLSDNNHSEDL